MPFRNGKCFDLRPIRMAENGGVVVVVLAMLMTGNVWNASTELHSTQITDISCRWRHRIIFATISISISQISIHSNLIDYQPLALLLRSFPSSPLPLGGRQPESPSIWHSPHNTIDVLNEFIYDFKRNATHKKLSHILAWESAKFADFYDLALAYAPHTDRISEMAMCLSSI